MNLFLHIVLKDLRRLRWPMTLWLSLVAAKIGLGFWLLFSDPAGERWRDVADVIVKGGMLLEGVITFILAAMLVLEDPLVGSSQFWITRPISGARLLAAKIAGFLLLLWLPAVGLMMPWWLTCGLGPARMAQAALEMLVLQAVAAAPAALVASLAGTFSRFIAWAPVLLFGFGTISLVLSFEIKGIERTDDVMLHAVAGWSVLALAAGGVVVRQYLRREVIGSLVWFGGGCVAAALVGVCVPMEWVRTRLWWSARWTKWHVERAEGISLTPYSYRDVGRTQDGETRLSTYLEVRGVPQDLIVGTGPLARETWRWTGGPEVTRWSKWMNVRDERGTVRRLLNLGEAQRDEETWRFRTQKDEEDRLKRGDGPRIPWPPAHVELVTAVLPSTVDRLRRKPPAYEARVQLRLLRPVVLHETPLHAGGWHAKDGQGYRVSNLRSGVSRTTNDRWPPSRSLGANLVTTCADFLWEDWLEQIDGRERGLGAEVVVAFPKVNELQAGYRWRHGITIGSVRVLVDRLWLGRTAVRRGDQWVLPEPDWADGAKIALITYSEEARFSKDVKVERFENAK